MLGGQGSSFEFRQVTGQTAGEEGVAWPGPEQRMEEEELVAGTFDWHSFYTP